MKKLVDYEEIKESLNNALLESQKYMDRFKEENTKRVKTYYYLDELDSDILNWYAEKHPKKYNKLLKDGKLFIGYDYVFKNKQSYFTWLNMSVQHRFLEAAAHNLLDKYKDKVITVPDSYNYVVDKEVFCTMDDMSYIDINCSDNIADKVVTRELPDNNTLISITCPEDLQGKQANVTYNYILNRSSL